MKENAKEITNKNSRYCTRIQEPFIEDRRYTWKRIGKKEKERKQKDAKRKEDGS